MWIVSNVSSIVSLSQISSQRLIVSGVCLSLSHWNPWFWDGGGPKIRVRKNFLSRSFSVVEQRCSSSHSRDILFYMIMDFFYHQVPPSLERTCLSLRSGKSSGNPKAVLLFSIQSNIQMVNTGEPDKQSGYYIPSVALVQNWLNNVR